MRDATNNKLRAIAFRLYCRHAQGPKPNILLYCTRRGGSTWLLNGLAAHPGMRYLGRPFMVLLESWWRKRVPDLDVAAGGPGSRPRRHIIHFEDDDERRFHEVAGDVVAGRIPVGPSMNIRAPYFNRVTDRLAAQMTSCTAMIEYFDANFDVATVILLRHPISNALSIEREGWEPECFEFLEHDWFRDTHLSARQVDLARRIEREGSLRERHVLDWCLKMLVPIRAFDSGHNPNWLMLSYEHLILDPARAVGRLGEVLHLSDEAAILEQLQRPSRTVTSTTAGRIDDVQYLLARWREQVDSQEEQLLMGLLEQFELDAYLFGQDAPQDRFAGYLA